MDEADGKVCAELFVKWAQDNGMLDRVTPEECADLAEAFIAGYAHGAALGVAKLTAKLS